MASAREQQIGIVSGVSGVSIGAGVTLGPIELNFARPSFVSAIFLAPRSALASEAAALRLRIQDETSAHIFFDSLRSSPGGAPGLALAGRIWVPKLWPLPCPSFWYPVQRPVDAGDKWLIEVVNGSAGSIVPLMGIAFEEEEMVA